MAHIGCVMRTRGVFGAAVMKLKFPLGNWLTVEVVDLADMDRCKTGGGRR
jgi:hypothetical protein